MPCDCYTGIEKQAENLPQTACNPNIRTSPDPSPLTPPPTVTPTTKGPPQAPVSTGRWQGPPQYAAYRGCGQSGARDLKVLYSHSPAPWLKDLLIAPASGSTGTGTFRRRSLSGAGWRGQTRRGRRGKEAWDCENDWRLRMSSDPAIQQMPFSDSGNSTAAAAADLQVW